MPVKMFSLIYGQQGVGKTALIGTFARKMFEQSGKRTRLYSAESAQSGPIAGLIDAGIIRPWFIDNASAPFERWEDAVEGGWPVDPDDPLAIPEPLWCYVHKGVCKGCGGELWNKPVAPPAALTCQKCKTVVPTRIVRELNPKNGMDEIGCIFYEGLTAAGEAFVSNLGDMTAAAGGGKSIVGAEGTQGKIGGEDVTIRFTQGRVQVGSTNQSGIYMCQRQVGKKVLTSKFLPVDYVFWTARDEEIDSQKKRIHAFGPKLPGSAMTAEACAWFGPVLSLIHVPPLNGQPSERRIYLEEYFAGWNPETKNIPHKAQSRLPAGALRKGTKDEFPSYYKFDPNDPGLLWSIVKEIEKRQQEPAMTTQTTVAK